jgi:hypothetical protein
MYRKRNNVADTAQGSHRSDFFSFEAASQFALPGNIHTSDCCPLFCPPLRAPSYNSRLLGMRKGSRGKIDAEDFCFANSNAKKVGSKCAKVSKNRLDLRESSNMGKTGIGRNRNSNRNSMLFNMEIGERARQRNWRSAVNDPHSLLWTRACCAFGGSISKLHGRAVLENL